jgi:mevalonate kinase
VTAERRQPVATGAAPGKVILSGEHSVVYGHPCVAAALSRGTTVRLRERAGPTRAERVPLSDPRLQDALTLVLPQDGLAVEIESDLPVGRGLGSSAALAVALVRASAAWKGETLSFEETHQRGFVIERVFHGNPSGVDHAVAALGGAVQYRMLETGPQISPLSIPRLSLVVLDSGATGNTKDLVASVAAKRPRVDGILDRMGDLTASVAAHLEAGADAATVGPLLTENHSLLRSLGVSTPALDQLVSLALQSGAHGAKLAGAGGGGVVIALVDDPAALVEAACAAGVSALPVTLGG